MDYKIKYFINLTNGIEFIPDLISNDIYFVLRNFLKYFNLFNVFLSREL